MTKETAGLTFKVKPGEYLCTWLIPSVDGAISRVPGILTLEGSKFPEGWGYGSDVPMEARESPLLGEHPAYAFPQTRRIPMVRAELTTGDVCSFVDAVIDVWAPERVNVRASAALAGRTYPATEDASISEVRAQVTNLDSISGVMPIHSYAWPKAGGTAVGMTMTPNPDAQMTWRNPDNGEMTFKYRQTKRGAGYGHQVLFTPTVELSLYEDDSFAAVRDLWISPLVHITQIATASTEQLTWLQVGGENDRGRHEEWQVFAPWVTQAPYHSDPDRNRPTPSALQLGKDNDSLLALVGHWQSLTNALHPLAETFARDLRWLLDQPPNAQFLTLCQAFEGWYNHEHRQENDNQSAEHKAKRTRALQAVKGSDIPPADKGFIKKNLGTRPISNLARPLNWVASELPPSLSEAVEPADIVRSLIAEGRANNWADAIREIRNDLSHGNRTYPRPELRELVQPIFAFARAATLLKLGASVAAQVRALSTGEP